MSESWAAGVQQMLTLVESLPDQLLASATLPGRDQLTRLPSGDRQVLLCGMGGSAIAGDLVRPLLARAGLSLQVHRDYGLPDWVRDNTLVVASSYSGNTEETLSAFIGARERGCPILVITTGGELYARASAAGDGPPILVLPKGMPPRASLGYGLGALLWGLHGLGLLASPEAEIIAAVATLREGNRHLHPEKKESQNEVVELARRCGERFLVIYTTGPEAHGAGQRWKTQLNENAKLPAYAVALPELNHNDIVGWELPPERREAFNLVLLRGGDESPRLTQRLDLTRQLLAAEFPAIHEVRALGESKLARILSLVQFGDYLSCLLARERGVDPLPVTRIDRLKENLQEGTEA